MAAALSAVSIAITEGPSLRVVHSLWSSLRAINAWIYGTSIHFPWEWQNRSTSKIVSKSMVLLTGQISPLPSLYWSQDTLQKISLRLRIKFLTVGEYAPQRGVPRHCGLVSHVWRDKYVTKQELEASLQVSELFWAF